MICRSCKNDIPDGSAFCNHCGKPVKVQRKRKAEFSVPKPRRLASGEWGAQVMKDGKRLFIVGDTEQDYRRKALAFKLGVASDGTRIKDTLRFFINDYIDSVSATLSPATIRGYRIIEKNRFQAYMDLPVSDIDFQRMLNAEVRSFSPKTVVNSWGLVTASLKAAGLEVPDVKRPQLIRSDEDFLDYLEIRNLLAYVHGMDIELPILLALHGLRTSEFLDLDVSQITSKTIYIRGATVPDENNIFVHKDTNKNDSSRREVPIFISRLNEILPSSGKVVTMHPSTIRSQLAKACTNAGVTVVSPHDLRRSFVTLAFHLGLDAETTRRIGGWSNLDVVNKVYRKLADSDFQRDVLALREFYEK